MKKITFKSILFLIAVAIFCGGLTMFAPTKKSANDMELVNAQTIITTATREALASTTYKYEITSYSKTNWYVEGGNLGTKINATSAAKIMEYIDADRLISGSDYHDCVLYFENNYLYENLSLKHGNYYITAPSGGSSTVLAGKMEIDVSGDLLSDGYYVTEDELPCVDTFERPSKGLKVYNSASLYIYDCTIDLVDCLTTQKDSDAGTYDRPNIVIDNASVTVATRTFESRTLQYGQSQLYGAVLHEIKDTPSIHIWGDGKFINNAVITGRNPVINYFSGTTEQEITEFEKGLPANTIEITSAEYSNLTLSYDLYDGTKPTTYNNVTFKLGGYVELGALMKINMTNYDQSKYYIQASGEINMCGDPVYTVNGNASDVNFYFTTASETRKGTFYGVYDITKNYEILIDEGYSSGDTIVSAYTSSNLIEKFTVTGGYIGQYIGDDTTDATKLIATTEIVTESSKSLLKYKANYYKIFVHYTDYTSSGKELYVPAGGKISGNYHGHEITTELMQAKNEGYNILSWEHYSYAVGLFDVAISYTGDIEDIVPIRHGEISPKKEAIIYNITFDTDSLKGASVVDGFNTELTIRKVGTTITLPTLAELEDYPNQTTNWKFLGWSLTADGEIITTIAITKDNYTGIKLYAVYQKIWAVYFSAPETSTWVDADGEELDEVVYEYYVLDGE